MKQKRLQIAAQQSVTFRPLRARKTSKMRFKEKENELCCVLTEV